MSDAPVTAAKPWRPAQHLSSVPYLPGLDGMRALAVVAVMVYHANTAWLAGGFLGVEVFFVISGYLITLLLMAERERTGRIDLVDFWIRRARRLLPGLFVMLFLLLAYSAFFKADVLGRMRGDFVAGLAYVSNWYQIWVGQGYSASGDFLPLRHLWSLAVEEQFYLVWPLVAVVLLRGGTRRLGRTALGLFAAALAVAVMVAVLFHRGPVVDCEVTPGAYWQVGGRCVSKADTLYLSTVTRSTGLLLGAGFAMVWRPVAILRGPLRHAGRTLDIACLIGLAVLGLLCWRLHYMTPDGPDAWLFRGGFVVTGLATLVVIAAATHRYSLAGRLLGNPLLRYVGTRSYGLYLFHWPVYQVIRKVAGNPLSLVQFVVAMAVTLVLTELSYTYVETPVRRREVAIWWASLRRRSDPVPRQMVGAALAMTLALGTFGTVRMTLATNAANDLEQSIEDNQESTCTLADIMAGSCVPGDGGQPVESTPTSPSPGSTVAPPDTGQVTEPVETTEPSTTTTSTTTPLPTERVNMLAIGDSVMLGAANELSADGWYVDAQVSRQMGSMIEPLRQFADAGLLGKYVLIHLGTNGPIEKETLQNLLAPLNKVPVVILVNYRVNKSYTAANNAVVASVDGPGDNVIVLDWYNRSNECQGCFADDGYHLNAKGAKFYADLVTDITGIG